MKHLAFGRRFGPGRPALAYVVAIGSIPPLRLISTETTIMVDSAARFQTISGWECVTFAAQEDPAFPQYRAELFERVIDEAGINRIRVEVRSGAENTTDFFAQYQAAEIPYATWRANRYATVNDNADPNAIDPAGYHFTELDRNIRTTVLPLCAVARAKGEPLYVNLNYVAFTGQIAGGSYHHQDAAEYAEFILAAFLHMDREFGLVPDGLEILLEPDNVSQWNGTTVGNAIVAVEARLSAAGYSPEIIAPSCTNMGNAVAYFDALAAVPGALSALDEICYHRYGGVSDTNLQALALRGRRQGKRTSMLEWWSTGNGIDTLFKDLAMGETSAWQHGVLCGIGAPNDDMPLYMVDASDPSAPVVAINRKARLARQVYRFVRRGAVRVGASVQAGSAQALAFINPGGARVVVIRAPAGGAFRILGLPAGTYGANYSTAAEFNVSLPDQTLADGSAVTASMPASGALTVYEQRPVLAGAALEGGSLSLMIRSLKPGFRGAIERTDDLANPDGWQEAGITGPEDFVATWSGRVDADRGFLRFRQP